MLKIAYSPIYKYPLSEKHRFPMIKYELIPEQLIYEGTVTEDQFFHPDPLTDEQILLTHTSEFLDKLKNQTLSAKEIRAIGFPMTPLLVQRGRHIAKGTLLCAQYAMNHGVAINVAGGTHHSFADHGEGFCIYNDIALSAHNLLAEGLIKKVLVVDLDVHQGNGTAKIFEGDDRVFTWSVHGEKNYPTRKEKSDLDTPLPDKTEDQLYLKTIREILPQLIDKVEPDIVFYLSGVDILESDKLGRLSVTLSGCKERDRIVLETCHRNSIPVAISMGGGYSPRIADIVEAHSNTYRLAQEIWF